MDQGKKLETKKYSDKDCSEGIIGGKPSSRYDFVQKHSNHDSDSIEPELKSKIDPICVPWYHYYMKVGSLWSLEDTIVSGNVLSQGDVVSNNGLHVLSAKKNLPFDMPHPNKPGWRLRHVCIEGPEISVYCRGTVFSDGIINLPNFWDGLVNYNDMTINLTPIGKWQELYIDNKNSKKIVIKNNNNNPIYADYHIIARRLDDDLIVEYEGENYTDYPGGNEGYSFNYDNDYVEKIIKDEVSNILSRLNV